MKQWLSEYLWQILAGGRKREVARTACETSHLSLVSQKGKRRQNSDSIKGGEQNGKVLIEMYKFHL